MKHLQLLLALGTSLLLSGCWGYRPEEDDVVGIDMQQNYQPVTMSREALEASVMLSSPQPVEKSGKIYVKDNLLFIADVNKGFHIYNYSNPQNPQEISFLKVPGATDVAMRGNTLYINQATDLVTLVYANNTIYPVKRNKNVFPQKEAPDASWAQIGNDEIIVDWIPL